MDLKLVSIVLCSLFLLSFPPTIFAIKQSYIVYMGSHSHSLHESTQNIERVRTSHLEFLSSFLESDEKINDAIIYSYKRDINGFAAKLSEDQAASIAKHPNVVSVFLNTPLELLTTHSWEFLSMEKKTDHSSLIWKNANYGEDIIIANIDTGVWPESDSFSDDGYSNVPSHWKGRCQNDSYLAVACNKKLIGAKFFNKGYIAIGGIIPPIQNSARDFQGHGTHTLSTAGGNFVAGANVLGAGNGTAEGGSPRARVAAYKVCWPASADVASGCYNMDTMKAMDTAIYDGVDVLSLSIGGGGFSSYFDDPISITSFHAVKNGIPVVCAGGNDGPFPGTVHNVAPWLLTVAASSIDREFKNLVKLGNGQSFEGKSLTKGLSSESYSLVAADQAALDGVSSKNALLCKNGTLDPSKVEGKVVVCLRGVNGRLEKGFEVVRAGGSGMIICNDKDHGTDILADPHFLPASHVTYKDGVSIFAYLNATKNPTGYISASKSVLNEKPAPSMAFFSSRGPNLVTPAIMKPDITAPGVDIIAAYPELKSPSEIEIDPRRSRFAMLSGTSMSTPHVAGVVGLIKKIHPDWSPAAIKSSIMTTARTRDNRMKPIVDDTSIEATPLNYGSGHIRPNRATNPGLVYDLTIEDHLYFLCAIGYEETKIRLFSGTPYKCPKNATVLNYNYPSMTIPDLTHPASLTRTLKNVGPPGTYIAKVIGPPGISVTVNPSILKFEKVGEEKSFVMNLKKKVGANITSDHQFVFGKLLWSDGKHYVRSPISVSFGATKPTIKTEEEQGAAFKRRRV
ncbi:subtilisin-like protease SBT5.4 [Impatiens glandulifera]|uniref:subtilisin-like protease SBT5.4 n=1 Tax=Impatiens glandulifera TaxID=253017 RepID=UPI001FB19B0C|nr:subtilisin-like protease SBT5.4 [Impatiens glandulifera]